MTPPDSNATNGASLVNDGVTSSVETFCAYQPDAFGTPGLAPGACAGDAFVCEDAGTPGPEVGPGVEPGVEPDVIEPNTAPEIFVENIVASGSTVTLRWGATDTEDGDEVEVSFFYDLDDTGFDGVLIARGLPGGTNQTYAWNTTGTPPGTYRVFGRVTDSRGEVAYAYANGTVQVGGVEGAVATLTVIEPDGVNDSRDDGAVLISWDAVLPQGTTGSVSLYYDTDDTGLDGVPIAAGLTPSGEGSTLVWQPVDVATGTYAIYATLDWTGGEVSAYGGFVSINTGGCGCSQVSSGHRMTRGISRTGQSGANSTDRHLSLAPFENISAIDLLCAFGLGILLLLTAVPRRSRQRRSLQRQRGESLAQANVAP